MKTPTPRLVQEDNIHRRVKTSHSSRVTLLKKLRDKNNMDNKHQNKRRIMAAKDKCSSRLTLNKLVKVMGAVAIHLNSSSNMEGTVQIILTLNSNSNNMEVAHMDNSSTVVSKAMQVVKTHMVEAVMATAVDSMEDKWVMDNRIKVTHLSNLVRLALL